MWQSAQRGHGSSEVIVATGKDEEALILQMASKARVGDVLVLLPELVRQL